MVGLLLSEAKMFTLWPTLALLELNVEWMEINSTPSDVGSCNGTAHQYWQIHIHVIVICQSLQAIDELFLFLNYLALSLKQRDLTEWYGVHKCISRIILTWSNFLFSVLGSRCISMTQEIKEHLPSEFEDYPDTTILNCTELRCQTLTSPLFHSEVYSIYESHWTLKGMIVMASKTL